MRTLLIMLLTVNAFACPKGCEPYHEVCACDQQAETAAGVKPDDAKLPERGTPTYMTGKVTVIDEPNVREADEKSDKAKADADAEGKRKAGIK